MAQPKTKLGMVGSTVIMIPMLLVAYVLISGPVQLVKTGLDGTFRSPLLPIYSASRGREHPVEYADTLSRWHRPFDKLFHPLESIAFNHDLAFYLESYWDLFAERPRLPMPVESGQEQGANSLSGMGN